MQFPRPTRPPHDQDNKRFVLRTQAPGCAGAVCKALGIALLPLF